MQLAQLCMFPSCHSVSDEVLWIILYKPEEKGKRTLGRSTFRRKDNIKMDLIEVGWTGTDWIVLSQDRESWRAVLNAAMNFRVH